MTSYIFHNESRLRLIDYRARQGDGCGRAVNLTGNREPREATISISGSFADSLANCEPSGTNVPWMLSRYKVESAGVSLRLISTGDYRQEVALPSTIEHATRLPSTTRVAVENQFATGGIL